MFTTYRRMYAVAARASELMNLPEDMRTAYYTEEDAYRLVELQKLLARRVPAGYRARLDTDRLMGITTQVADAIHTERIARRMSR